MGQQLAHCENCGNAIGRLERAHLWGESVVCEPCYKRLRNVPTAEADTDPLSQLAAAAPASQHRPRHIEQTSKAVKKQVMRSSILVVVSALIVFVGLAAEDDNGGPSSIRQAVVLAGIVGFLIGSVWYVISRMQAYWRHG